MTTYRKLNKATGEIEYRDTWCEPHNCPHRPLPKPEWTRPGETWRVEPETARWVLLDADTPCDHRSCEDGAVAGIERNLWVKPALCATHLREGLMWIEAERVVSWCLSR
jgi:hypothetical protein